MERWEGCCGSRERREASGRRRWAGPLLSPQAVLVYPTPSFPTSVPFLVFLLPGNPPQPQLQGSRRPELCFHCQQIPPGEDSSGHFSPYPTSTPLELLRAAPPRRPSVSHGPGTLCVLHKQDQLPPGQTQIPNLQHITRMECILPLPKRFFRFLRL